MRLSFSIVDRHVVFGRPTFLLPSGVQVNAVSHLLFLSIRRICPTPGLKKIMIFIKKIGFFYLNRIYLIFFYLFDFFEIWYIDIYIDV